MNYNTLTINTDDCIELGVDTVIKTGGTGTNDYNVLINKPRLDGVTIQGDMYEKDPTVPDWAKAQTRPTYTANDVGAVATGDIEDITLAALENMWNTL